ncbi:Uncharacterised protein [Streptococcus acidominimus]|uniref:Uncharacterized protein n=1 Tax=Streptococcus acidominimus TaxID=1326 RepID=A0A239WZR5_STRAI|nr:hypothetical protein [Streptococcus acidominimus]SNV39769.1 Uncharacterised protein [Streptococcus acidominimus]
MGEFKGITTTNSSLEVYLTDYDLEYIANGFDLKIPLAGIEFDSVIIKHSLINDLINPIINFDKKNNESVRFAS